MQQSFNFEFIENNKSVSSPTHSAIYKGDKWDTIWQELKNNEELNYIDAERNISLAGMIYNGVESIYRALTSGWTANCNWSSGKDSEVVLHLLLIAMVRAVREGKKISKNNYLLHTDTLIENPEVRWLAEKKLAELEAFIAKENLPLTIVIANPGISSSWTGRILTGRGLPTFSNSSARQCTHELKINAARRARAEFIRGMQKEDTKKICLLLGSRDAEGSTRAGNIAKRGGKSESVTVTKEGGELYPIKCWLQEDVWSFLLSSGSGDKFILPSYLFSNFETAELYKDATGECVWSTSDKKASSGCGARFGCSLCQAVGLDKSMERLLASNGEKYGYMDGLNRIQRFLAKRRYAWDDRHPIGRTIYAGGYIKIQPDVYSPRFLERLLRVCCSMDYMEQRRADKLAENLRQGVVEDNEWHRRMATPQFRLVSEQAIVHIEFMWAFHHFNTKPFRAIEIYRSVWLAGDLDLLEDEPDMPAVPKSPIPKPLWVKVGKLGDTTAFDGLADPLAEMTYFDPQITPLAGRTIKTAQGTRRVVSFSDDDEVKVDQESAEFIIWTEYPRLREDVLKGHYTPGSAAIFLLRFGVVSLCKGKASKYNSMMQRGQTYKRLGLCGDQTMESVAQRRDLKVITEARYRQLVVSKLTASIARLKWWSYLAFFIAFHRENRTPLGKWIENTLAEEKAIESAKEQNRQNLILLDKAMISLNYRSWLVMELRPVHRDTFRAFWRSSRYAFLSQMANISSVENVVAEWDTLLSHLILGDSVESWPHGIATLAVKDRSILIRYLKCQLKILNSYSVADANVNNRYNSLIFTAA